MFGLTFIIICLGLNGDCWKSLSSRDDQSPKTYANAKSNRVLFIHSSIPYQVEEGQAEAAELKNKVSSHRHQLLRFTSISLSLFAPVV
ncbi:G patch domain-containing protein 8-like [Gossypium australe]|uniref:G patch domain-containing protein 8-like n=1 Tax=Gossypium australe TaxID=47621 RepID=A0A5B6WXZ7_9ROSI|nr:G patch domain-containing protein 8-like [Gossypium australe]